MIKRELDHITEGIIGAAIEVHRVLGGPGLLEIVYEEALTHELKLRRFSVQRQTQVPISYKNQPISHPLRLDMLVNQNVIVEVKATTNYNSIFEAQLLTYLRLMDLRVGLVINFGHARLIKGVHRVVNQLKE